MAQRSKNHSRSSRHRGRGRSDRPVPAAPVALPPSAETSLFGMEVDPEEVRSNEAASQRLILQVAGLTAAVVGVPLVVIGLIVAGILGLVVGLVVGLGCGALRMARAQREAERAVARLLQVQVVDPASQPRLANLVDALSATFGLSRPTIATLDDPVPNACALVANGSGVLVVTTSLLDQFDLIELEGVLAHEMAHLRRGDARRGVLSVWACGALGPLAKTPTHLHRFVGRGRELRADQIGAASVRYPVAMAAAMARCEASEVPSTSFFAGPGYEATRWLWFDPSVARRSAEAQVGDNDATSVRRQVLEEW